MPEVTPPEGSGTTQTPETPAQGTQTQTPAQTPQTPEAGKTFTQADVDRIVQERLARAVPADLEDLRRKAGEFDALEEKNKTELQKAQDAATAEGEKATRAMARVIELEIAVEAAKQGADTDLVAAFLRGSKDISVDKDGNVTGVASAVKKALDAKPNLKLDQTPGRSGGEFGGREHKTIAERIAELEAKGDAESLREARVLKIEQTRGAT